MVQPVSAGHGVNGSHSESRGNTMLHPYLFDTPEDSFEALNPRPPAPDNRNLGQKFVDWVSNGISGFFKSVKTVLRDVFIELPKAAWCKLTGQPYHPPQEQQERHVDYMRPFAIIRPDARLGPNGQNPFLAESGFLSADLTDETMVRQPFSHPILPIGPLEAQYRRMLQNRPSNNQTQPTSAGHGGSHGSRS